MLTFLFLYFFIFIFIISTPFKVINISDNDSLASSPRPIKKDSSPFIRRSKQGPKQQISLAAPFAKLQLGYAVKEKQHYQNLVTARGKKTGI
jgi:hypothetical protein